MYGLFLILHVVGAVATGIAALYVMYVLVCTRAEEYRFCALMLGALTTFEVCTGTILSVLSVKISATTVCERVLLYLTVVSVLETLLFVRMNAHSMRFPLRKVVSPVAASLLILAAAFAYGF